eukprot:8355665-Pyramimonas_sp.AAC.2
MASLAQPASLWKSCSKSIASVGGVAASRVDRGCILPLFETVEWKSPVARAGCLRGVDVSRSVPCCLSPPLRANHCAVPAVGPREVAPRAADGGAQETNVSQGSHC